MAPYLAIREHAVVVERPHSCVVIFSVHTVTKRVASVIAPSTASLRVACCFALTCGTLLLVPESTGVVGLLDALAQVMCRVLSSRRARQAQGVAGVSNLKPFTVKLNAIHRMDSGLCTRCTLEVDKAVPFCPSSGLVVDDPGTVKRAELTKQLVKLDAGHRWSEVVDDQLSATIGTCVL